MYEYLDKHSLISYYYEVLVCVLSQNNTTK